MEHADSSDTDGTAEPVDTGLGGSESDADSKAGGGEPDGGSDGERESWRAGAGPPKQTPASSPRKAISSSPLSLGWLLLSTPAAGARDCRALVRPAACAMPLQSVLIEVESFSTSHELNAEMSGVEGYSGQAEI